MKSFNFDLPKNLSSHRKRLAISYEMDGHLLLQKIIETAAIFIEEEVSYDNWNGGTYGHKYIFFVSEEVMRKIGNIAAQNKLENQLDKDFNAVAKTANEFIDGVSIEIFDETNSICRKAIPPSKLPHIDPEQVKIWKPGYIRLFISHRDKYKREASQVAELLEEHGISCFVAHDSIEPLSKWRDEIWNGLFTMEVFLAFLTDDFSDSKWTDQEIGIALGRGIPTISLKLQNKLPYGFIYDDQAIKGNFENLKEVSDLIFETISEKIDSKDRMKEAAIESFSTSISFDETITRFNRLKKFSTFSEDQINRIISAYHSNDQLHNCGFLGYKNRITYFIHEHTGKKYTIERGKLINLA